MGTTTPSVPPVVEDARVVHARVVELLGALERALTVAEARGPILELSELLPAHRDEERAVFAEVLEVRPELGPSVAAFAGQHVRLLELVHELARLMPDDGVSLAAASMFVPELVHALREHERSESELLFAVWQGQDTGTGD